jgi:hypothetical protein
MKESLTNLIQKLLKRNKISFDREELVFQVLGSLIALVKTINFTNKINFHEKWT